MMMYSWGKSYNWYMNIHAFIFVWCFIGAVESMDIISRDVELECSRDVELEHLDDVYPRWWWLLGTTCI
jgi:hypothetical protein